MATIHDESGRGIGASNPLPVKNANSDIIQPVDVQAHYQQTIQTHNAVSVPTVAWSIQSSYMDCDGFDKIAINMINDAGTTASANIIWSTDGVTQHGEDSGVIPSNATQRKSAITDIKARYAKVSIYNSDTISHTISAWAFLKA